MDEEKVILVDKDDVQLGLMPKMEAHKKGVLHRAFSIQLTHFLCKKGQCLNITLLVYGQIPVVVIKEMEKVQSKQLTGV